MKRLFIFIIIIICRIPANAQILPNELNDTNAVLYKFISDWWRTPYRYGGTSKRGIDCSSFTQKLYKTVYDVNIPRVARYQYTAGKSVSNLDVTTGDLVFFKSSGPSGWHVGFYLADGWFVHSGTTRGVFINNISEEYYSKMLKGFKRIL